MTSARPRLASHGAFHRVTLRLALLGVLYPSTGRAGGEAPPPPPWKGKAEVILQGFHWNSASMVGPKTTHRSWWALVGKKSRAIGKHFDAVWLPPAAKAAVEDKHGPFAQGYLPYDLTKLDSDYGKADQLERALRKLTNVLPVADIVLNHVAPRRYVKNDGTEYRLNAKGDRFVNLNQDDIASNSGGSGARDTGQQFTLVADVDHRSPHAQKVYGDYLASLRKIGFKGLRYDFAKGVHPAVIGEYNADARPEFSVAELWEDFHSADSHRDQLLTYVKKSKFRTSAFDFTTKAVLQDAVSKREYWRLKDSSGRPAGLIGIAPEYAVTFVDNHDTGSSPGGNGKGGQKHWEFPGADVMQGYAYILTHPGRPCVYWPHYFDWQSPFQDHPMKGELDRLIGVRKQAGVTASSPVEIVAAGRSRYAAYVQGQQGLVAMKIGPGDWMPDGRKQWKLAAQGRNYAVWIAKDNAAPVAAR